MIRVSPDWLALREPADAQARSAKLVEEVSGWLAAAPRIEIHDLGCGTGSMARWLAPLLPGPQHWILYDADADLLARASASMPAHTADGFPVTVETRECDVTKLTEADFRGASLVTASALLDILSADEIDRVAVACAKARRPALFTLSVTGQVDLEPCDPLDSEIVAAFNAHQRRVAGDRTLLGPSAAAFAAEAFTRAGASVRTQPSPWTLGPERFELVSAWFAGWFGAACEQRPELAGCAEYARGRFVAAKQGRLRVTVHHSDLLAIFE